MPRAYIITGSAVLAWLAFIGTGRLIWQLIA